MLSLHRQAVAGGLWPLQFSESAMHLRADVWGLHWCSVQRDRDGDWHTRTTWHHQDSKVSLASAEKEHKTSGWVERATPYVHGFTSENGGGREEKSRAWRLEIQTR